MNIVTDYWPKPIPMRGFDWAAYDADTYDIGSPTGYGATKEAAIADLMMQLDEEDAADDHARMEDAA